MNCGKMKLKNMTENNEKHHVTQVLGGLLQKKPQAHQALKAFTSMSIFLIITTISKTLHAFRIEPLAEILMH